MQDLAALIQFVNQHHATSWSPVRKLPGGYQQGAYELVAPDGDRAVLKWHAWHMGRKQLRETAQVVEDARQRGWPTPRWLAHGPLPDDGAYVVEEFIDGTPLTALGGRDFEALLRANRIQADLRPRTDHDWSAYIRRVVFEGEGGLAARMRERPETGELMRRLTAMTADAQDLRFPTTDLVHGDFVLLNVLVRDGTPYLIDAGHAGKGTRAYDLATLLMEVTVGGDWVDPSGEDARRLRDECLALVGRSGLLVCTAARMLDLLVFGLDHWPAGRVPACVARCQAFLDSLSV